jgi:hypothetical protein
MYYGILSNLQHSRRGLGAKFKVQNKCLSYPAIVRWTHYCFEGHVGASSSELLQKVSFYVHDVYLLSFTPSS